jgi:hypothetical protein
MTTATDPPPLHVKATLRTRAGEFVCRVSVPDFHPAAEVLVWGTRTFTLAPHFGPVATSRLEYREALAFHVVQPPDLTEP